MDQVYSPTNITTGVFVGLAGWTIVTRFRSRVDSNWPMIFYLLVVIYHQALPSRLNPYIVFAGVVSTLLLRFEFMGGRFLKVMRAVDVLLLAVIGYLFASNVVA